MALSVLGAESTFSGSFVGNPNLKPLANLPVAEQQRLRSAARNARYQLQQAIQATSKNLSVDESRRAFSSPLPDLDRAAALATGAVIAAVSPIHQVAVRQYFEGFVMPVPNQAGSVPPGRDSSVAPSADPSQARFAIMYILRSAQASQAGNRTISGGEAAWASLGVAPSEIARYADILKRFDEAFIEFQKAMRPQNMVPALAEQRRLEARQRAFLTASECFEALTRALPPGSREKLKEMARSF